MVERVYLAGRMALGDRAPAQPEDIGLIAIFLFLVLALSLGQQAWPAWPSARARSSPLGQLDLTDPSPYPAKEHAMTQEITEAPQETPQLDPNACHLCKEVFGADGPSSSLTFEKAGPEGSDIEVPLCTDCALNLLDELAESQRRAL